MSFSASITRRKRKRTQRSGAVVTQIRYVLNFREPRTGRRKQLFFERHNDAIAKRDELATNIATGTYSAKRSNLTVAEAVEHWLENRRSEVKAHTWDGYKQAASYITGPLLAGTPDDRRRYTETGAKPEGARFIDLLGPTPIADLATADIRSWHKTIVAEVGHYTANRAKMFLRAALALAAEDFHLRVPPMPLSLGRGRTKQKKAILTPDQVGQLLKAASEDKKRGVYYAFPFLTGVRPSEQLALRWEDVDLQADIIRIRRMQELDGTICDLTKTIAGMREIPISPKLKAMLLEWRLLCPRKDGQLYRVFPGAGLPHHAKRPHTSGGGTLVYANFRARIWRPALLALGLPYVTPHSARHAFISTLQAKGVEVGLVAKLAGHANATVTLSHYTQAVRGGESAMRALEEAYTAS